MSEPTELEATAVETPTAADAFVELADVPVDAPTEPQHWLYRAAVRATSANPVTVTILSFVTAMVVGAILIVVSNRPVMAEFTYFFSEPSAALSGAWSAIWGAYSNLFEGALFDPSRVSGAIHGTNSWSDALFSISETLKYAAPLIFTGLAVALAFRGGLFNIGAQGQAIFGAIGAGLVGFELHLPVAVHLIVALLAAILGGALWGVITGALKARTGAHEVIVTIMLNNIALLFLGWLITSKGVQDPARTDAISKPVGGHATLPPILGAGLNANLGLILALGAAVFIAWLLARSTFGFELRAVGSNPAAARTAGMSVAWTYTIAMAAAGALSGLGGATVLLGTAHQLTGQVVGNIGFDGVTVALLGRGKPWGVVWSALLFGGLAAGGNRMQSYTGVTVEFVWVLQAVIVILIAAPRLIKATFHLRADRSAQLSTSLAKGW
jgi:general nucleoside transport system permease protein